MLLLYISVIIDDVALRFASESFIGVIHAEIIRNGNILRADVLTKMPVPDHKMYEDYAKLKKKYAQIIREEAEREATID